jgi:hypothetical protein
MVGWTATSPPSAFTDRREQLTVIWFVELPDLERAVAEGEPVPSGKRQGRSPDVFARWQGGVSN